MFSEEKLSQAGQKNNINNYSFNNFDYYNDNINHNFEFKKMHQ